MAITLKPLTAIVTHDKSDDSGYLSIRNDDGEVIIGPIKFNNVSSNPLGAEAVFNDRIEQQIKTVKLNIVAVESEIANVHLPKV